jgi:hypothetical protein
MSSLGTSCVLLNGTNHGDMRSVPLERSDRCLSAALDGSLRSWPKAHGFFAFERSVVCVAHHGEEGVR